MRRSCALLPIVMLTLWQWTAAHPRCRHCALGHIRTRGFFSHDAADILPYGVLQHLHAPRAGRGGRWHGGGKAAPALQAAAATSTQWQVPAASTLRKTKTPHAIPLTPHAIPLTRQRARMPRLERTHANGRHFRLYDVDGEHLMHVHYHDAAVAPPQRASVATAEEARPQYADGWRPIVPSSSTAAAAAAMGPTDPQVQHFWLHT